MRARDHDKNANHFEIVVVLILFFKIELKDCKLMFIDRFIRMP